VAQLRPVLSLRHVRYAGALPPVNPTEHVIRHRTDELLRLEGIRTKDLAFSRFPMTF